MPVSQTPRIWLSINPMTQVIHTLASEASAYDAIVFDQWGVLHNGEAPYPHAVACIAALKAQGAVMAVLSNSGKRAAPNAARIAGMGFERAHFTQVMSSGEALWLDISRGLVEERCFFPIERAPGDARIWAEGLDLTLTDDIEAAEAVLLMGLPDGSILDDWQDRLAQIHRRDLTVFCTNPDKASPRGDEYVISPGVLAFAYKNMGGAVRFYGKPHAPIFDALQAELGTSRILMVGDSLEHDIAGAHHVGWDSVLIQGGLYARAFAEGEDDLVLAQLTQDKATAPPTYRMEQLR